MASVLETIGGVMTGKTDFKELKKKMQNGLSKGAVTKDKQQKSEVESKNSDTDTDKTESETKQVASAPDNTETFTEKKE